MTTTAFKKELWETALLESFKGISVLYTDFTNPGLRILHSGGMIGV